MSNEVTLVLSGRIKTHLSSRQRESTSRWIELLMDAKMGSRFLSSWARVLLGVAHWY
jgi:hypothetical protein